jgi:two-component system chemotaxis sensor kinase CheA
VLLEMVDAIRRMLANIEASGSEGEVDCEALIERLQRLTEADDASQAPSEAAPAEAVAKAPPPVAVAAPEPAATTAPQPVATAAG